MVDLNGKVVLVTGGGTGVGRAIVHALADEGCRVVAIGRRREKLEETVAAYAGTGSIAVRALDVSARKDVDELVSGVQSEFGPIDILVNNAGVNVRDRSLEKLSPDDWDYLIRVNLTGAFLMTRAVLPSMRQRRDGLIVNISSIAGKRASTLGGPAYSASKFGMTALAGVVGLEEADKGIRSSVVFPGEVNTPILDDRPVKVSDERKTTMLQPEDVAAAVLLIAKLPARANIPELIIKPTNQEYV